jgi:hypothetical protein
MANLKPVYYYFEIKASDDVPIGQVQFVFNFDQAKKVFTKYPAQLPDNERFPHRCPKCDKPAYIGMNNVECSAGCK